MVFWNERPVGKCAGVWPGLLGNPEDGEGWELTCIYIEPVAAQLMAGCDYGKVS